MSQYEFDVVVRGGLVVDGTGAPAFPGDVGIRGGKIAAVAPNLKGAGKEEIDARGKVVTPGFVGGFGMTSMMLSDKEAE